MLAITLGFPSMPVQFCLSNLLTEVIAICGLLVFFPRNFVVFVEVIILPDFCHVFEDVAFLHSLNPVFQFLCGDEAIFVIINSINNFPAGMEKVNWIIRN